MTAHLPWSPPTVTDPPTPVTPGEIDAVEFTQVRNLLRGTHGYQENEVDEFLDRCAATIADLMRANDALAARVERAERKLVSP